MKMKFLLPVICSICLSSCVSMNKYKSLEADYQNVLRQRNELNDKFNALSREHSALQFRTQELEAKVRDMQLITEERDKLQKELKDLRTMMERLNADYAKETTGMSKQIQADREELLRKEDELFKRLQEIEQMQAEMDLRNRRMAELESILARKDSAVNALKAKVSDALLGFEGKGLTVTQKNGKVYVSMEDKLLFKSGSYEIDPKGAEAVKELGKVLALNTDINVMIEGHTDNVPYKTKTELKDNWDLSVKRATTVVRVLLQNNGVDPRRVIAAGHSEYAPLDDRPTAEARQKNRRTEIILTPKLDELLNILDAN
ncbi:MAG: OmpA family protein [Bacteroidales bacterium]|nr:OmpA family protein [Bacteroidales bacterium]MCL2133418.1 OmpA family protein [Bacteroidales bacterium]